MNVIEEENEDEENLNNIQYIGNKRKLHALDGEPIVVRRNNSRSVRRESVEAQRENPNRFGSNNGSAFSSLANGRTGSTSRSRSIMAMEVDNEEQER